MSQSPDAARIAPGFNESPFPGFGNTGGSNGKGQSNITALNTDGTTNNQMAGLGFTFKPTVSGKFLIVVQGLYSVNPVGNPSMGLRVGTGAAPANGAAVAGAAPTGATYRTTYAPNTALTPFTLTGFFSGSAGVTYWIDVEFSNGAGSGAITSLNEGADAIFVELN